MRSFSDMRYANCFAADGTTPLTGDALFAARATHRLFFEDGDRAAEWQHSCLHAPAGEHAADGTNGSLLLQP